MMSERIYKWLLIITTVILFSFFLFLTLVGAITIIKVLEGNP